MSSEKYNGNWTLFWITGSGLVLIALLGYFERGFDRASLEGLVIGIALMSFVYWSVKHTYLEIHDKRTLINKGYKSFGYDEIDIYDIKYIYRVPAFPWKSWGSLMVIYSKSDGEGIRHSVLREGNYSDATLKPFLMRLKQLNPSIELDQEYEDFLAGKLGSGRKAFIDTWTNNTKKSVEDRLRAKGEIW